MGLDSLTAAAQLLAGNRRKSHRETDTHRAPTVDIAPLVQMILGPVIQTLTRDELVSMIDTTIEAMTQYRIVLIGSAEDTNE